MANEQYGDVVEPVPGHDSLLSTYKISAFAIETRLSNILLITKAGKIFTVISLDSSH
jgi:hypothetical protein